MDGYKRGLSPGSRTLTLAALVLCVWLLTVASASAQSVRVLVFHGGANATNDAGVAAIKALGTANDFAVDASADATTSRRRTSRTTARSSSSTPRATASTPRRRPRCRATSRAAAASSASARAAEAEPGNTFFDGLIGARPTPASPTATTDAGRRGRRPRAPGDARPAARVDAHRRLVPRGPTRPTGTVHTVARYRAPGAPAGDGTTTGGTDSPISWCRDYQRRPLLLHRHGPHRGRATARPTSASTCSARSSGPRASSAATARRRSTPTTRHERLVDGAERPTSTHSGESHGVAIGPQRLGASTSAAATAAPTPSAAR